MITGQSMALGMPASSPNGSAPPCNHLDSIRLIAPLSAGCPDCQARGDSPARLLVCLTCGWVACSNESPGRHAYAHYAETDHPLARALDPASGWRWCYVHQRRV
jgi:uncharacterized UBP type Zn finger protein